jgi:hypothetical protein
MRNQNGFRPLEIALEGIFQQLAMLSHWLVAARYRGVATR